MGNCLGHPSGEGRTHRYLGDPPYGRGFGNCDVEGESEVSSRLCAGGQHTDRLRIETGADGSRGDHTGQPAKFLRSICRRVVQNREAAWKLQVVLILTKGLEPESNEFPIRIVEEEIPDLARGILSGPTFASQVADGVPSAIVLATSAEAQLARRLQQAISGPTVRVYTTDDLIGVELGGCLKNIYAIGAGICDGLGLGDNARAALLTRSLAEMVKLGTALGGKVETFYGLSGVGDLVLTCNGKESRNRTFGEEFAHGTSIQTLLDERQMTVEGYQTADCFHHLCRRKGLEMPILNEIHAMLFGGKKPLDAVQSLMMRELRQETE